MKGILLLSWFGGAALVGWTGWAAWSSPSPGELSAAHAPLTLDATLRDCAVCHGPQGLTAECLACHREIEAQHSAGSGYHAAIAGNGNERCEACHGEHYGAGYSLIHQLSWDQASPQGFAHEHTVFELHGAHEDLRCEQCHDRTRTQVLTEEHPAATGRSYLGLRQECSACHEDVHGTGMEQDCLDCHDQVHFAPASRFVHDAVFRLEGAHESAACERCHPHLERASEQQPAELFFDQVRGTACGQCHESPHTADNERAYGTDCARCHGSDLFTAHHFDPARHASFALEGAHAEIRCADCHRNTECKLGGAQPGRCESCHAPAHTREGRAFRLWDGQQCSTCHTGGRWSAPGIAQELHERHGFPLRGGHANTDCAGCHNLSQTTPEVDAGSCATCHEDPHQTSFGKECSACHLLPDRTVQKGYYLLTAEDHARSGFTLAKPHADLQCRECHGESESYAQRYPGRSERECIACHQDPHRGQFESRAPECTACHEPTAFLPARIGIAEHAIYPLEGSHRAVACNRCHQEDPSLGARRFAGTPRQCASCHADPHGGQFAVEMQRDGCAACHSSTERFEVGGFDHERTRFSLKGAHREVRCDSCHRSAPGTAVRKFRGLATRCDSCHEDPHRGQLTPPGGKRDCSHCHPQETWLPVSFDHEKDARFRLAGGHESVGCLECHPVEQLPDGRRMVRYVPLGTECRDCHEPRRSR